MTIDKRALSKWSLVLGALALGLIVGLILAPRVGSAQSGSGGGSVAGGPGGMWVVENGSVRICNVGITAASARPPTPVCGNALSLR